MLDGGPAFPTRRTTMVDDPVVGFNAVEHPVAGMSLRDWFAGMAMQAWLTNDQAVQMIREGHLKEAPLAQVAAVVAYQQADAMLIARQTQETEDADQGDVPGGGG